MFPNRSLRIGYKERSPYDPPKIDERMMTALFDGLAHEYITLPHEPSTVVNGQYYGSLAWLQNGSVDIMEATYYLTIEKYESFKYTSVVGQSSFYALYPVVHSPPAIRFSTLAANFSLTAYVYLVAILILLIVLYQTVLLF
jgi:hypothetical protein